MAFRYRKLMLGQQLALDAFDQTRDSRLLTLTLGTGAGVSASTQHGISVWLAIRGRLHLGSQHLQLTVEPGQMLIWTEGPIQVCPSTTGRWLVLAGSNRAWRNRLVHCLPCDDFPDPVLYPFDGAAPIASRKGLLRLAAAAKRASSNRRPEIMVQATVTSLWDVQRRFEPLVARCSGQTYARRCHNLQRLLRVRNHIRLNPANPVTLNELAKVANYSPWHLVRAFREVFGEAPIQYAHRVRMKHGRTLLEDQRLSIAQVAERIGFESGSSFARAFRKTYGVTAGQVRQRGELCRESQLEAVL